METEGNVVLYFDKDPVIKSKEHGFNLNKTFENHLKQLVTQFSKCNSVNNANSAEKVTNEIDHVFEQDSIKPWSTSQTYIQVIFHRAPQTG
jgi:hypothetical protein